MSIYIRFENNKQVETTVLENKPEGWHEAPKNFDWQRSYRLTEGGKLLKGIKKILIWNYWKMRNLLHLIVCVLF